MSETALLREIMVTLSQGDCRLFRMQSGNFKLFDGRHIRIGFNGLSDLIGWNSVVITPDMIGQRIAQFVALEGKSERGRARENQENFLRAVLAAGGIGAIVRSKEQACQVLNIDENGNSLPS